jgi:hypothetical protein
VLGKTLTDVAKVTSEPVLLTETGANPVAGRARAIASLFSGVEGTPRLLGFIWFDYDKTASHNWRIDADPGALAAFKAGAKQYVTLRLAAG